MDIPKIRRVVVLLVGGVVVKTLVMVWLWVVTGEVDSVLSACGQ